VSVCTMNQHGRIVFSSSSCLVKVLMLEHISVDIG
jgi:hypothetical protein